MNEVKVLQDKTGCWVVIGSNGNQIGTPHNTELEAYKSANWSGYIVR